MIKEVLQRFFKGWSSDVEPSQQGADTVRDMNNMRIMAENKNSASVQNLLGTIKTLNLNPNYFPIGWCKLANSIVVFSTKDINGSDQNGEIGVATIDPITLVGTYVPYYNHQDLDFNSIHQIEVEGYDENESKRRVYWTDDYNPMRRINLLDSRLTTYIASGSLVVGQQYMVIQGTVQHAAVNYGPNESVNGTVFTATGAAYVVITAPALVIEYINVSTLDIVPQRDQGNITYNRWLAGGSLLGGGYQYCYQLMTNDGVQTNFSYVTKAFHTTDPTTPSSSSVDYQAVQGSATNENSGKGIRITIDNIDQDFDQIRVVSIRDIGETATDAPVVIFEGDITGASMDFDHFGTETLGSLSVDDLAAVVLAIKRVNTLAILKQKMFIGNVKTADFVPVDTSGFTLTPIEYRYQVDKTGRPTNATDATTAGMQASGYEPETGLVTIDTDQWYEVLTTPVTYNAVVYGVGDTFQGVAGVHVYVGAGTVRAVTRIQKYTGAYRIMPVRDDYTDTKNAGVATVLKSHHRGEIYRYGILIYDVFQNPQYVHWIKDWECPALYDTLDPNTGNPIGFSMFLGVEYLADYGGLQSLSARSIGINFSNIDFNPIATALGVALADLDKYIGGFSIVRAKRDKRVIGQGILSPCSYEAGPKIVRPTSTTNLARDKWGTLDRYEKGYTWHSPEFLFNPAIAGVQDGDYLEVVDYIKDTQKATTEGTLYTPGGSFHYYEKFYETIATPAGYPAKGSVNNVVVPNCLNNSPNAAGNVIGTTGDLFNNSSDTAAFVFGVEKHSVGGWDFFMYTEDAEPGVWANGFAYQADARSLVNLVRPKSNLYGGTSDAAKAATEYIFCGHYQPMDSAFMTYMVGNGGIADDVEVFGGDTFVSVLDVARMMREDNTPGFPNPGASFCAGFLVESSINLALRQGRHVFKDRSFDELAAAFNTNGVSFSNPTQLEEFAYNTGYSYEESQLVYTAVPLNFLPNNHFRHRVYGSPMKIDGELVDNFSIFPVNDFKDIDGTNGDIINLRAKVGKLFYFQQDAAGYLPVFEREIIPNQLGAPTTIGTGGALERYDDIVNYFGNQHQFGLGETEDAFIWFDARRKELCTMNVGGGVISLSLADGLRNEFANIIGNLLLNDNPVRNNGIAITYNQPLKEMMISFRGVGDPSEVSREPYAPVGFAIGYDNVNKQFTGKFDLLPGIMLEFNNLLILAHTSKYLTIVASTAYAVGKRLTDGTSVYVCILAYTSASPPIAPSADATHWRLIMELNEVHISDKGDVCKFFGYVYPNSIAVVVNPDFYEDKVFDTQEMQSSQIFFDTLTAATSGQSGTDTSITTSDDFRYIYTSWHYNLPFDTTTGDRLRDKYMTLTLTKDNKLSGQYWQSKNERVKIVSLKTSYRKLY